MRRIVHFLLSSLLLFVLLGESVLADTSMGASSASEGVPVMTASFPGPRTVAAADPLMEWPQLVQLDSTKVRLSGPIRKIPEQLLGEWFIGDVAVFFSVDTHMEPKDYQPQLGDWANAWAIVQSDGSLRATYVRVKETLKTDLLRVVFKGLIEEVSEDYLVVSSITVRTDEHTQLSGGVPLPGFIARVSGFSQTDGSVKATQIRITSPFKVYVQFEGRIGEFPSVVPRYGVWQIGRFSVIVDERTGISGSTPSAGLSAEVSGVLLDGESIQATGILVVDPTKRPIEGIVRSIEETEWLIGDTVVRLDQNTFVDESKASAVVGAWAEASVRVGEGEGLVAIRIRLGRPH